MSVFLSVCLSVYPSVCISVQAITFEPIDIDTSLLEYRYIFTISRSSLSIMDVRSRSYEKNDNFTCFNMLILCMLLQIINKVNVTIKGQGHIKVKVKDLSLSNFM